MRGWNILKQIVRDRRILWSLTLRDFGGRYLGTRLGFLWGLITPFLFVAGAGFVFSRVFGLPVDRPVTFLLAGLFPWLFFAESVGLAVRAPAESRDLVLNFGFSPCLPVLSRVLSAWLCLLINLCVVVLIGLFLAGGGLSPFLPLVLPLAALLGIFTAGIALAAAAAAVVLRDTRHAADLLLLFGVWVTPVFYRTPMLPEPYSQFVRLNPVGAFIDALRGVLWGGAGTSAVTFCVLSLLGAAFAAFGLFCWARVQPGLAKKL